MGVVCNFTLWCGNGSGKVEEKETLPSTLKTSSKATSNHVALLILFFPRHDVGKTSVVQNIWLPLTVYAHTIPCDLDE